MKNPKWTVAQSEELYLISGWGAPYFAVNRSGHVVVMPQGNPKKSVNLKTLVDQLIERGISTPFLLRFNEILTHRLQEINDAFSAAIENYHYNGSYTTVYPIKVNQQRHVVEQITKFARKNSFGLEAGSKPELLAVMALTLNQDMPIVCNGYKDKEFFEIALMGMKIGKKIFPVIEKYSEFETMIHVANELNVKPTFGVRVKLSTQGAGKWRNSAGHRSKFGLALSEVIRGIDLLKRFDLLDGFQLLHFHLGSQITDIGAIKNALKEIARVYVELKKLNIPLNYLDVGGGLGVDYDGSRSKHDSSMNYSVQDYANDVVFQIQEICDQVEVEHPHIFSESGRAVAAHHSVLIFDIVGKTNYDRKKTKHKSRRKYSPSLKQLLAIRKDINRGNALESYYDAISAHQECLNLFTLGFLTIEERAIGEEIYFEIMILCRNFFRDFEDEPEEIFKLEEELADTFFCNFSVFQSLPDYWAIDHVFPIMPISRLDEEPERLARLADITCDSDGKVDSFIDPEEKRSRLIHLHSQNGAKDYYLGVFLVGAYQETLGDLHNLFGDTNAVHVTLGKNNKPIIETVVKGDTVKEVLTYVQYDVPSLVENIHRQLEVAVRKKNISFKELGQFMRFYEEALEGYTYLEDTQTTEDF